MHFFNQGFHESCMDCLHWNTFWILRLDSFSHSRGVEFDVFCLVFDRPFTTLQWLSAARVSLWVNVTIHLYYVRFWSFMSIANIALCLSLLFSIFNKSKFPYNVLGFIVFFYCSISSLISSYRTTFTFLTLLLKSDICHTAGVIWKELKRHNFVFLFPLKHENVAGMLSQFVLFPPLPFLSQFYSCSPFLLHLKSKFYLLLVAVCSLTLLQTSKEIRF